MKYIKASLCSLVTFCCLSYIHSAEDLFAELKRTKRVFTDENMSESERNKAIDKGFDEIKNEIFPGSPFPEFLKTLYKEVGNLGLSLYILSPIRGLESPLYDGIREGQYKKIPGDWVVFAEIDGCEYFCINRFNLQVARFFGIPGKPFKQCDTYLNPIDWVAKILLED